MPNKCEEVEISRFRIDGDISSYRVDRAETLKKKGHETDTQ